MYFPKNFIADIRKPLFLASLKKIRCRFCNLFSKEAYLGLDIIDEMIQENIKKYEGYRFGFFYDIPSFKITFDLVFCFTTLQHLSEEELDIFMKSISMPNTNIFIGVNVTNVILYIKYIQIVY